MKPQNPTELIPRNNWDYGFGALLRAIGAAVRPAPEASGLESLLHQQPLWTNSGRTSLYTILKALDLPAGAQVGVPLFCCSVVFNAICQAGLTPRFIDSNMDDCDLSVDDLRKKRPELAAVVAVHMFGRPCDMDEILEVAGPIPVIEDCAQSLFSTYKGKPAGSLSTASFFSFRCGKYISAGEGSAIFCRDARLRERVSKLIDSFESPSVPGMLVEALMTFVKATLYNRPWYGLLGYPVGTRLDKKLNLTAKDGFETGKIAATHRALVEARIGGFPEKIKVQRRHAERLAAALMPAGYVLLPASPDRSGNAFQFALRFQSTAQRDAMAAYLFEHGVDSSKYLDTIAEEACEHYGYRGDCSIAELLSRTILLVPIHYTLRSADIDRIARSINEGAQLISKRKDAAAA
jgi:perosamine synthetase